MRKADAVLKRPYGLGPSEAIADQKPRVREGGSAAKSICTNQQWKGL
jgi:hypothetical protein